LLRLFDADKMRAWKVDPKVGNVRNDTAELLQPFQDPQADNPKLFNLRGVALTAGAIFAGLWR
jgi:hypothetical protein